MKRIKIAIFSLFFLSFLSLSAQYQMLYVDSTSALGLTFPVSDLSFLDTDGNSCVDVFYGQVYLHYSDICISPDGTRYGFHRTSSYDPPIPHGIYEINNPSLPPSNSGSQALEEVMEEDSLVQGLTCDTAGLLYAAGKGITIINAESGGDDYLGDLPPDLPCQGDLTMYNENLYMVATGNKFVEINLQNPSLSEVMWEFAPDILPIHALATFKIECDSSITYAIGQGTDYSVLYQIDYENQVLNEICDVPEKLIQGAASYSECANAPCDFFVDLDVNDSSGGTENNFIADTICVPPVAIVDNNDVAIFFEKNRLDSLTVTLSGISDIGMEYLTIPFTDIDEVLIGGSGTDKIKMVDENGTSTMFTFEFALQTILYENDAFMPTNGTREITVIAYYSTYISTPSVSWITLNNEILDFNYLINEPDCFGQDNGSLSVNPTGGLAPYSIEWFDNETNDSIGNLTQGFYSLTLTDDTGCRRADTIELTQPDSLIVNIESLNGNIVCNDSGELSAIVTGGTTPYDYLWGDGFTEQVYEELSADNYFVTVTDANGCMDFAEYQLVEDTIFINQQEQICKGEIFDFNNETFDTDTSFCITFLAINGCDSVHCLDLQFVDTSYLELLEEICFGDVYDFNGLLLERDTSVCQTFSTTNGCDSIICLDLIVWENITELTGEFCEGDEYEFNGINLEQGGIYFDTFPAFNGCDSLIVLDLQMRPAPVFSFDVDGNFCLDEEITVTFNPNNDYLWETGETANILTFTEAGLYNGIATNIFDCEIDIDFTVDEAADLEISYTVQSPMCFGDLFGSIVVDSVSGGLSPYQFSLNGEPLQTDAEFEDLETDNYELLVEDVNGCQLIETVILSAPQLFTVDAGENITTNLGDTVNLSATTNIENPIVQWSPANDLECDTCLITNAAPQVTAEYQVSVTDANGCTVTDIVEVLIDDVTRVYIPTAFSPNSDNNNDYFFVQANSSIASVSTFRVFDRWGSLLFDASNISANEEILGWNGMHDGEPLNSGIYVYFIEILRIDGVREVITGDVFLAR